MRIAPSLARLPAPPPGTAAPATKFTAVLDERALGASSTAPSKPAAAGTISRRRALPAPVGKPAPTPGPVRAMLERTVGSEKQVDALLEAAARGKTFTPAQLLAMQATVARYSQTVEVVSRVADRLVGAVKQTMGTQV